MTMFLSMSRAMFTAIGLILALQGCGGAGLHLTQSDYQITIPTSFPVGADILRVYVYDSWWDTSNITCDVGTSLRHNTGLNQTPLGLRRNATNVYVLFLRQGLSGNHSNGERRYTMEISCSTDGNRTSSKLVRLTMLPDRDMKKKCVLSSHTVGQVCFGYRPNRLWIQENAVDTPLWDVSGTALHGCGAIKKTYTVDPREIFREEVDSVQGLMVRSGLDYENSHEINVTIDCEATDQQGRTFRSKAVIPVGILNVDDNRPHCDGTNRQVITFTEEDMESQPGSPAPTNAIACFDPDGREHMDKISAFLRGDSDGQFRPHVKIGAISDDLWYISARLEYAKSFQLTKHKYQMELVLRDEGYRPPTTGNNQSAEVVISYELIVKPNENRTVPSNITIFSTAANYTQVVPSMKTRSPNTYYSLVNDYGVFEIMPTEGAVFVRHAERLIDMENETLTLDVLVNGPSETKSVKINVTVIPSQLHRPVTDSCDVTCAVGKTMEECESSCGPAAPTGTCQWRPNHDNTWKYSTCSPTLLTCPDGQCDHLEMQFPHICPQDCTEGDVVNRYKVSAGERGILMGEGPCWCDERLQCECLGPSHNWTGTTRDPTMCDERCLTAISLVGFLVVVIVVAMLAWRRYARRLSKDAHSKAVAGSVASLGGANLSDYVDNTTEQRNSSGVSLNTLDWSPRCINASALIDKKWEFPRKSILLEKTLGEGEFGRVVRAQAYNIGSTEGNTIVAVKMLKECATGSELRDLLSEYSLLKEVSHNNVIKLLGACTKGGPFFLIVEYCEHGALRSFLRDCRLREAYTERRVDDVTRQQQGGGREHGEDGQDTWVSANGQDTWVSANGQDTWVSANDLMAFAWQMAKGMQYLSTMKVVHRDLAARNVLVAAGKVIKISDFGLSRDIYEEDTYTKKSKGRIPVKWMAPESLYEHTYTTKSDVWSYGVTLWEIVTLGATPYPGLAPERLYHLLKTGYRMERPVNCSEQLYRVMSWCWRTLPADRPTFTQLADTTEAMIKQNIEYLDLGSSTVDRHPILDDDNTDTHDEKPESGLYESDEGGYGSISRLNTDSNAYLNPSPHGPHHSLDDVICDDCTMRMIKEGDVTTESTKLLSGDSDAVNNNANRPGNKPLLYIEVQHDNSDEENERLGIDSVEVEAV